tara:strand:+ start:52 stop:600 length:549 start_codon:yes stop_codon:yes gene_type:complete
MHASSIVAAVLLVGVTGCEESRFDTERKSKERGASIESSFMTLEQARREYGGDEATLELMFVPAEALQALRDPTRIQAALSVPDSEPVFYDVPYSLAHRVSDELKKIENYGAPYACMFHEDFVLRLHGGTKDLLFRVCLGCGEFNIAFGNERLPRVEKLAYSPELGNVLTEIFGELKREAKK